MKQIEQIGPRSNGSPSHIANLFPGGTRRWVPHRKAELVFAVQRGMLSFEQACERYGLSAEELLTWQRSVQKHGLRGLRVSSIQHHRRVDGIVSG